MLYTACIQTIDCIYVLLIKPKFVIYKTLSLIIAIFTIPLLWSKEKDIETNPAFTYGSTPVFSAYNILKQAGAKSGMTFLDLGSGRGNLVFVAALGFEMNSIGIEIQNRHYRISKFIYNLMKNSKVTLLKENFLTSKLPNADIIFISNTCFPSFTEILLTKKLENLKIDTILLSMSAPLLSEKIKTQAVRTYLFSWGKGTVYFQRIVS
ncbi:MAG: hypothetical protein A2X42_00470 [Candidatus Margulisbacteria bacterium GWF2_38_17]|nr:MAG: hypothetical protein A2X43_10035 [Candidatus Margulisbacteria bacterium GWD2_39_127]OGI03095.1 MAG: hypothetical protein A2X42_00470 [Candidatus Margulisbacteria bacterium GWF2_38_17]OGI07691.1 MAG: hypothetical protein A2X41_04645 [Candidatus Margulisbacteria bacterium GWE2_39_32]